MKLQRLTDKYISKVKIITPVAKTELLKRKKDFDNLPKIKFSRKYNDLLYKPVEFTVNDKKYSIQVNCCINPFCRWYGLEQFKYHKLPNKPSRYKVVGSVKALTCNDIEDSIVDKPVISNYSSLYSNWGLAEEIKRLIDINTVVPIEPEYKFHKADCPLEESTPFDDPKSFQSRGKSTSNSKKLQCKKCKKITNILPEQNKCFTYHQKRNDILPLFMELILNRTPVTGICRILKIGSSTYYNKLEWLYRRCLEFNQRHEEVKLSQIHFKELWFNTDKFTYYLNNVRKKGHGKKSLANKEKPLFPTNIVATCDLDSRYIFRADVAYDYTITSKEIKEDYLKYKEEKLHSYLQKTDKYRVVNPTTSAYDDTLDPFSLGLKIKESYIDGFHINSTYTTMAQLWLLKELINVDKINIVSDEDSSQIGSIMRIYKDMITDKKAHVFTCKINKDLRKEEAFNQHLAHVKAAKSWKKARGIEANIKVAAIDLLAHTITHSDMYETVTINGKEYVIGTNESIPHPLPYKDEGDRFIRCLTDLSDLTSTEIAERLYKVDLRGINTFFNQIRRKVSILERPLAGGRSDGKSYIYANFNPKYAQHMVTILRTYLNFCESYKYKGKEITPAMRLGLTDKVFTIRDIIYFK